MSNENNGLGAGPESFYELPIIAKHRACQCLVAGPGFMKPTRDEGCSCRS